MKSRLPSQEVRSKLHEDKNNNPQLSNILISLIDPMFVLTKYKVDKKLFDVILTLTRFWKGKNGDV